MRRQAATPKALGTPAMVLACMMLAGCAGWGGNVRGVFRCTAPDGTCAPTAEIDAEAVRTLMARVAPDAPGRPGPVRTVGAANLERAPERVLRIVFYPHIDAQGALHEEAVVHAVVDGHGWRTPQGAPGRMRDADGEAAPEGTRPPTAPGPEGGAS